MYVEEHLIKKKKYVNESKDDIEHESDLENEECEMTEKEFYEKYWIEAGKLGEGAFGRVRKIKRRSDFKKFALKNVNVEGKPKEDVEDLQREIALHSETIFFAF